MADVDDAAHLQSMLEAFSDGELQDDAFLPAPLTNEREQEKTDKNEQPQKLNQTVLYIGNLSPHITENLLITLFSDFGSVRYCRLVNFHQRQSPYAFLAFCHHADADAARKGLNGRNYLGQPMKINWKKSYSGSEDSEKHFRIFVGNLDKEVTCEELRLAFAPFGEVVNAVIATDNEPKQSRGYGFVSYINKADAETAIETMHGQWIRSRIIRTRWDSRNYVAETHGGTGTEIEAGWNSWNKEYVQSAQMFNKISNRTSMNNRTIFVGNLNKDMLSVDFLKQLFERYDCGFIQNVEVFNASQENKPAFGFITFATKEAACNAIMCMHNKNVDGRHLKCDWRIENCEEENNVESEPLNNSFDFGQPIMNIQRTIPGYGYPSPELPLPPPPLPQFPPPQFPPPQFPVPENQFPLMPPSSIPLEGQIEGPIPTSAPPIDEKGHHGFSYYGTYVFQEKIEEKCVQEDTKEISPSPRASDCSSSDYQHSPVHSHCPSVAGSTSSSKSRESNSNSNRKLVLVNKKKKKKKKKRKKNRKGTSRYRSRSRSISHYRKISRIRFRSCSRSRSRSRSYRRSRSRSRDYDSDRFKPRNIYYRGDTSHVNLSMPNIHPPAPTVFQQYPVQNQNAPTSKPFQPPLNPHQHYGPNPDQHSFPNRFPSDPSSTNYGPRPTPPITNDPGNVNRQSRQCHYNPNFIYNYNQGPPNHINYPQNQTQSYPPQRELPRMQNNFIPPNNTLNPPFQNYNPQLHFYSSGPKFNNLR